MSYSVSVRQLGLTLIELTVVLTIIALGFSVISINISSGYQTTQLSAISRDLVSALRYVRGQALTQRHALSLELDLSNNAYYVESQGKQYKIPDDIDLTVVIAQDEFDRGRVAKIRFYPDGSSSGGHITLAWGKLIANIDINWLSGKIRLEHE